MKNFLKNYWREIAFVLVFIFVLLSAFSCAGVKKITKADIKENVKSETSVQKQSDQKTDLTTSVNTDKKTDESTKKTTTVDESETEQTVIHTVIFDPKLYVDSVPNRPLKVSETTQTTTKGKAKKAAESTETLYSQAEVQELFSVYFNISKAKSDSTNNIISSLKSELSEKTTQAGNWWKWLLSGMGLMGLAWVVVRFKIWRIFIKI